MDRERWRQIERIYHLALDRPPHEREALLDGDPQSADELLVLERAAAERPDCLAVAIQLHLLADRD